MPNLAQATPAHEPVTLGCPRCGAWPMTIKSIQPNLMSRRWEYAYGCAKCGELTRQELTEEQL